MTKSVSLSLVFVTMSKHTANSGASVRRGWDSREEPTLMLPVRLAWRGTGKGLSALGVRSTKLHGFQTISELVSYWCAESVRYTRRMAISQQILSLLGFFCVLIYFFVTNRTESRRVSAHIVSDCKPGGFLRFLNRYIYIYIFFFLTTFEGKWCKLHKSTAHS